MRGVMTTRGTVLKDRSIGKVENSCRPEEDIGCPGVGGGCVLSGVSNGN